MTWRERRTITILTTILLILAAMLLVVLGIRYRQNRDVPEDGINAAADPASGAVDAGFYTALSYSNGDAFLSFSQDEEGTWHWDANTDFPLDDATVEEILDALVNWRPQQTLKDQESLEAAGLAEPGGSLTAAAAKGGATTLLFGKATTDGQSCYVRLNGDESTVYIIDNAIRRLMDVAIYDMCRLPELPVLTEDSIASISIQGPAPEAEASGAPEDGAPADQEPGPLTVLTAHQGAGASWRSNGANVTDDPTVRGLMEDILSLKLSRCVDYDPSDEAADLCGFSNPQATLRIRYDAGEGQEDQELVLTIGNRLPDKSGRYTRLGGEAPIYLLETELLDPLMRVAANGLEDSGQEDGGQ